MARSLVFLSAAWLAGCAVGPNYVRPHIDAPSAFMGQPALEQRPVAMGNTEEPWWHSFNDPELNRLIDRALAQNLDLVQAMARVRQARAGLTSADAALLPSGTVTSTANRARLSAQTPVGQLLNAEPGFNRSGNVFQADVGAGWEIDLSGGLRRGRESAQALYRAARVGTAAVQLSVAAQTASTYIAIRGLQARIDIAKDQVAKQRQLVSIVQLRLNKGVASKLQLEQSQGALAQVEATVPVLIEARDEAMNSLDVLLGVQPGTYRAELMTLQPIPAAPGIRNSVMPADLIRRRPDLVVAEYSLQSSHARIGVALSEYYPKFSLSGFLGTATMHTGDVFTGGANEWQGTVGLRWRLFDFVRVNAEVEAARGRDAEQLAAYRQAVLRATEDVENSFSTLVNSEIQQQTLDTGEKSLTQARDESVAAYKAGVVSLIEVLDADSRLLSVRDARAQAQTQAARAAVASFKALGGGWGTAPTIASTSVLPPPLTSALTN